MCGLRSCVLNAKKDERSSWVRRGLQLEWFMIAWMVVEAVVAISAGMLAHSLTLTAFGIDSVIELFSAAILLWRCMWSSQCYGALAIDLARSFLGRASWWRLLRSRSCIGFRAANCASQKKSEAALSAPMQWKRLHASGCPSWSSSA